MKKSTRIAVALTLALSTVFIITLLLWGITMVIKKFENFEAYLGLILITGMMTFVYYRVLCEMDD